MHSLHINIRIYRVVFLYGDPESDLFLYGNPDGVRVQSRVAAQAAHA